MYAKDRRKASKGEDKYNSKFKEDDIFKIRLDKRTHKEIANDYAVSEATISHIKSGRNWGWLKEKKC